MGMGHLGLWHIEHVHALREAETCKIAGGLATSLQVLGNVIPVCVAALPKIKCCTFTDGLVNLPANLQEDIDLKDYEVALTCSCTIANNSEYQQIPSMVKRTTN